MIGRLLHVIVCVDKMFGWVTGTTLSTHTWTTRRLWSTCGRRWTPSVSCGLFAAASARTRTASDCPRTLT